MLDKFRLPPYTITILEINLKDKDMDKIDIAIEAAHDMHRAGICWDEAVISVMAEFDIDPRYEDRIHESYDQ